MKNARTLLGAALAAQIVGALPAEAQQITYQTLQYPGTTATGLTGFRGYNITGSYSSMGGLLYRTDTGQFQAYPVATANGANYPGAQSSQPYSPTFGSPNGILRAVGTFKPVGASVDSSYIWDNAAAPGQQATVLNVPGALNTIVHSQFGNQVVGNFNTNSVFGTIFNYNIACGSLTTFSVPNATSSSAYGIWADRIAGGYSLAGGHAFLYNQTTGAFTTYDAPSTGGAIDTHFEGITAGGRAGEFNLAAVSADSAGLHGWAVKIDVNGVATWIPSPGRPRPFANSIHEGDSRSSTSRAGSRRLHRHRARSLPPVTNAGPLTARRAGHRDLGADWRRRGQPRHHHHHGGQQHRHRLRAVQRDPEQRHHQRPGSGQCGGADERAVQHVPQRRHRERGPRLVRAADRTNRGRHHGGQQRHHRRPGLGELGAVQRFENSGLMGISAPGSGAVPTLSGVFVKHAARRDRAAHRRHHRRPAAGQRPGAAGRRRFSNFQPGSLGKNYTILTATGGCTGTFDAVVVWNGPPSWRRPSSTAATT